MKRKKIIKRILFVILLIIESFFGFVIVSYGINELSIEILFLSIFYFILISLSSSILIYKIEEYDKFNNEKE